MNDEVYLYKLTDSGYQSVNFKAAALPHLFPKENLLQSVHNFHTLGFNKYELLHMININKYVENKKDIEQRLNGQYEQYLAYLSQYKKSLPEFNNLLLRKFLEKYSDLKVDCLVIPESSNGWLRKDLANTFSNHFNIPITTAIKNDPSVKLSNTVDIPKDFKFIIKNLNCKNIENVVVLDDQKGEGSTMDYIEELFLPKTNIIEVFYCKSK